MKAFITIKELKELLDTKKISPQEAIAFFQARIKKYNPQLNAVVELFEEATHDAHKNENGLLAGIPYLLKDLISQKGKVCSAGSKMLQNYRPTYDATVHARLQKAGGFSLGRTNMDEFAMGSTGEFSAYGPAHNPWDLSRTPGGSSSGSATSVAAGLIPFALGSETGGSMRAPAAFCGLVGFYPTYGLFSRYGIIPFASSNDQVGPFTRTVYDNALVSSVIAGHDAKDSTSLNVSAQDFTRDLDGKLPAGIRIGILRDGVESEAMDPVIKQSFMDVIKQFEALGAKTSYIDIPHLKYANAIYFILSRAEASSNLARYDGSLFGMRNKESQNLFEMYEKTRHDGFGIEVKRRILIGTYALSASQKDKFYRQALHVREVLRAEYQQAFKDVDVIISPTMPVFPFKLGETLNDPLTVYLADYLTVPSNVIGTPALALPCGYSPDNLPIGFQILGQRLSEALLYKVAYAFEQSTPHHLRTPAGYE